MSRTWLLPGALSALLVLTSCASSAPPMPGGTLAVPLSGDMQPIAEVEEPFGAAIYRRHAVAIRIWPDSLDDGLAEVSLYVTNGSWNTLALHFADVTLEGAEVMGQARMLAYVSNEEVAASPETSSSAVEPADTTRTTGRLEGDPSGSRRSGDLNPAATEIAIAGATTRATASRHPPGGGRSARDTSEVVAEIRAWYLDTIEVYPGDTGVGGLSIRLPAEDRSLTLTVAVDGDEYQFPLVYTH